MNHDVPQQDCTSFEDCFKGQYCGSKAGMKVCLPCKNCQADFNRENSTANDACAQSFNGCGHCLQGHSDLPAEGGVKLERCVSKDASKMDDVIEHLEKHGSTWVILLKIAAGILGVIVVAIGLYGACRKCHSRDSGSRGCILLRFFPDLHVELFQLPK